MSFPKKNIHRYNPITELSVALAAGYLGQKSEDVAKSLPPDFSDNRSTADFDVSERASHHSKDTRRSRSTSKKQDNSDHSKEATATGDGDEKERKKRKKKKSKRKDKDGKFLPKITVRDLVNMLEPQLFKVIDPVHFDSRIRSQLS